jgi:hypothetical protein
MFARLGSAKEVYMATVKCEQRGSVLTPNAGESVSPRENALEPADFELDDLLRTLRVDQWFAMAEEGMPIWVC